LNSSLFERVSERLGIEEELLVKRALDAYIFSKLREIELEEDRIMKRYGVSSIREFEEMVSQRGLEALSVIDDLNNLKNLHNLCEELKKLLMEVRNLRKLGMVYSLFEKLSRILNIEKSILEREVLRQYIMRELRDIRAEAIRIMERYGVSSFEEFKKRFEQGELENVKRSVIEVEYDYFKLESLFDSEEILSKLLEELDKEYS